jgi:hypothetical protein
MKFRVIAAASTFALTCAMGASAFAAAPTFTYWAAVNDNGGLGGSFGFLNSGGVNPLTLSSPWTTVWSPTDVVYDANLGLAGAFSNDGSWDGSSHVFSFGLPDTTTYGEWFVAPSNATLSQWDFLINNVSAGENATFVLATWDPSVPRAVTALFSESSLVVNSGGYAWNYNSLPGIALTPGADYVAYLTVGATVPEPSTWAMMALGFAGLGLAGYRGSRKSAALAA